MSAPPYMKFFWGDYFTATRRLNRLQHSAYLLLLGEMWVQGGKLPADDAELAAFALCTPDEWAEVKPVVMAFFKVSRGKITQKRLAAEMAKYDDTKRKRKEAGRKGGLATGGKDKGNAEANAWHLPTKPEPELEPEEGEHKPSPSANDLLGDEAVKGKTRKRRPETAIPDGYPDTGAITDGQARLRKDGVDLDAKLQAEKFRNHAAQTDRRCRDWAAAWRNWLIGAAEKAPKVVGAAAPAKPVASIYDGPPELRAMIVAEVSEAFAASYIDQARWTAATRQLIARNAFAAEKIRTDCRALLERVRVTVTTAEEAGAAILPFVTSDRRTA